MNHKLKIFFVIISIVVGIILVSYIIIFSMFIFSSKSPNMATGEELKYYNSIIKLSKDNNVINLSEVFKFEWDKAYIVSNPKLSGKELADKLGIKCDLGSIDPLTPVLRIVFINKNQFVYDFQYDTNYIQFIPVDNYFFNNTTFLISHKSFEPIV